MSDSSEDEDMSRFREAVDTSFTKLLHEPQGVTQKEEQKPPSERYLESSGHYNDVKVPEKMQMQIGEKISKIINKNIQFVDVDSNGVKKRKIKGGVKLFSNSESYLSTEVEEDTYTETHNSISKKLEKKRRKIDADDEDLDEDEKLNAAAVSGEYVLSKEEIKCWKSRRKEKVFKYKSHKNSKVLKAIE